MTAMKPDRQILSAKATGVLFGIIFQNLDISAENIALHFKEGKRATTSALLELRNQGFLATNRGRTSSGTFYTKTVVTQKGYEYISSNLNNLWGGDEHFAALIYSAPSASRYLSIGHNAPAVITNSGFDGIRDEVAENTQTQDELILQREKEKIKREKYVEKQEVKHMTRMQRREHKERKDWTPTDSAFEFASRIYEIWNIKPWQVTQSKLVQAIAQNRRKYETNGELEFQMMNRFFELADIEEIISKIDDANTMWQMYIYRFANLASWAKYFAPSLERDIKNAWFREEADFHMADLMYSEGVLDGDAEKLEKAKQIYRWAIEAQEKGINPLSDEYLDKKRTIKETIF
jgi:hypothetical protein